MGLKITGTGSCIPKLAQKNDFFSNHNFYDTNGRKFEMENQAIIEKFSSITGIKERKYALPSQHTSDLSFEASEKAISDAKIDHVPTSGTAVIDFNSDDWNNLSGNLIEFVYPKKLDFLK